MKAIKIACVLTGLCMPLLNAQQKETDCMSKVVEALDYANKKENFKENHTKALTLLKSCVAKEDTKALLLTGKLYLKQNTLEEDKKAFLAFEKAAELGDDFAMTELGVLYKYGRGCKLNYKKAQQYFEKAAELGNSKAAYCLGYMYLKGLGTVKQDYNKTVQWFEKSDYNMANYWLGVCYAKGYGVVENTQKANELLQTDFNSAINSDSNTTPEEKVALTNVNTNLNEANPSITEDFLLGKWQGFLLKLDWSAKHIEASIPVDLGFQLDEVTGTLKTSFYKEDQILEDDVLLIDGALYFDNTTIELPHERYKENIPETLTYKFLSSDFHTKSLQNITYLVGNIESYIPKWNEAGTPMRLILQKKENVNDKKLTEEALLALSQQENRFIKLYPNPFQTDVIVAYSLKEAATISVLVTDMQGNTVLKLQDSVQQTSGDYHYFINGSELKKGTYIVNVYVNKERKTNVIIKK